jgi:hypothetical protein
MHVGRRLAAAGGPNAWTDDVGRAVGWRRRAAGARARRSWRVVSGDGWCNDRDGDGNRARFCEVREATLRPSGTVTVDARPTAASRSRAATRARVRLQVKVMAVAGSDEAARQMASAGPRPHPGTISADGPGRPDREWWTVSYRLTVPRAPTSTCVRTTAASPSPACAGGRSSTTTNGGVTVKDGGGSDPRPHDQRRGQGRAHRLAVGRRRPRRHHRRTAA